MTAPVLILFARVAGPVPTKFKCDVKGVVPVHRPFFPRLRHWF